MSKGRPAASTKRRPHPRGGKPAFKRVLPPAPLDPAVGTVSAVIEAVVFANQENGFAILRGADPAGARVVLKGILAHVHVGESVECDGEWKEHPEHGWSFAVSDMRVSQPHTLVGMATYLESAVHGIGPVWAKAIVDTFGERTFEMIDEDPSVLHKVRTASGQKMPIKTMRNIIEAWSDARAVRRVMVFLATHGVTSGLAAKIHREYGERALDVLQEDPYQLVSLRGVGFRIADRIARNLDVPLESPQRIQAGIVFCLREAEGAGHCYLREDQLAEQAVEQLMLDDPSLVTSQLASLLDARRIILEPAEEGNRVYLPELFFIEKRLGDHAAELAGAPPNPDVRMPERPTEGSFVPNDGQWQAIEHALTHRLSLISGLPGTGKTTLIRLLLQVIDSQPGLPASENRYLLASPTGKAARRLAEASGREAQTIHRMLQWAPSQGGFLHNEENPLEARFVIVDETSMVDVRLADSLVRAIGPQTHLVLVGDADQLPPVGAGKVFDDLIASQSIPTVRLTEIFRQAARSLIVRNAHRIVSGKQPFRNAKEAARELDLDLAALEDDFFFVHRDEPEDIASTIVDFAARRIPRTYGLDPIRDVLVLAPMKAGPCGLEELNARLQATLNPDGRKLGVRNIRVGDRVIQTRNDYNIEVMNGEVGVVRSFDGDAASVEVDFGDRTVEIATADLDTFILAYAISVHRSQGSQAPAVVCATATSHFIMLTRSLVNTAVTRAQRLCVCVGQDRAMKIAVRTPDARQRNSALAERVARRRNVQG